MLVILDEAWIVMGISMKMIFNLFNCWVIFFKSFAYMIVNAQVDRKLVKQTVMTSVYGVTYVGARDQIKRRLKERNAIADDSELFAAACYAAKVSE